jgi:dienelactone hydrolase
MAEVLLFHHALGPTAGIDAFAATLRAAGHTVHAPDLFAGRRFESIDAGMAHVEELGFETIVARGAQAAFELPVELVYAGFSLGVVAAQKLAQTRPGARGAVLFHACVPTAFFGPWPTPVPVQIHAMADDPVFTGEGDLEAAREVVAASAHGDLFLYPGSAHCFADASVPSYDAAATALALERVLAFLATAGP